MMTYDELLEAHKQLWLSLPEYANNHEEIREFYTLKLNCAAEMYKDKLPYDFDHTACFLCIYSTSRMLDDYDKNGVEYPVCCYCPGQPDYNAAFRRCLVGFYQLAMRQYKEWTKLHNGSCYKDEAFEDFALCCDIVANLSYIERPEMKDYEIAGEYFAVDLFHKMKKERIV